MQASAQGVATVTRIFGFHRHRTPSYDETIKAERHVRPDQLVTDAILIGSVLLMLLTLLFSLWQALLQS